MKTDRLFEMVYILLQKNTVTARELAERFEVSQRTVYRDLDSLSAAGVPIYASKGKGGGIRLMEGFVLDRSVLSDEEKKELSAALQSLRAVRYTETEKTIKKLGAFFNMPECEWVDIDFSGWGPGDAEKFRLLKEAVLGKRIVRFEYSNTMGESLMREVEPLQLCFKDRAWYLKAYCRIRSAYRVFKLSRIRNIQLTEERFERTLPPVDTGSPDLPYERIIEATLHFEGALAYRVYDEFDNNQVTKNADGSFTVKTSFPENEWVFGYILSFGSGVRVVEPESMADEIKSRALAILEKYERNTDRHMSY